MTSLTDEERVAISAVVHQNYYMPDVFAAVNHILAARAAGEAGGNLAERDADLLAAAVRGAQNTLMRPGKKIENTIDALNLVGVHDALRRAEQRTLRNRDNTPTHVRIAQSRALVPAPADGSET